MSKLRIVLRLVAFLIVTVGMYLVWSAGQLVCLHADQRRLTWRNWVFGTWARLMCRVIGVRVRARGPLPQTPFLLVTNHLSYLDVIVIAAQVNCTFVAKQQVATWPLLGAMAQRLGIIFLNRDNIADVPRVGEVIQTALQAGQGVVLFPEGTSSPGQRVLPFYSPLFEPVVRLGLPVNYASLNYNSPDPAHPAHLSVCWWGDMTFLDHLLGLFALPHVEADVHFGVAPVHECDRKRLAKRLHTEISQIFTPSATQDASLDYTRGPAWLKATGH